MRTARSHPLLTGTITSVVLLFAMVAIVISGIPSGPDIQFPWNPLDTLHVQLADADALAPHASVEIAGVKVGEVETVQAAGQIAVATLRIAPQYADVHSDATVYLRPHGLFGPKYIDIVPGTAAAPVLPNGGTITVAHTVQPVDLDSVLQALQAPEQRDLRTLIVEFGQAASGRGDDVNHLLSAADTLTRVLDSPLKAVDAVAPQLSDALVQDEAFNAYFAQAPLDQLVANSEAAFRTIAADSSTMQALLINADKALGQLDTSLSGQPQNLAHAIQELGKAGGTVDRFTQLSYTLSLFGANLTGKERALGTDPASIDVTKDIISAITNIASSFVYSDPCPKATGRPGSVDDNHCAVSPDGRQHYLQAHLYHFPPTTTPNAGERIDLGGAGSGISIFSSLLAS